MVNGKFIFIKHLPLTTYHYFHRFSKTNSEKYGADHFLNLIFKTLPFLATIKKLNRPFSQPLRILRNSQLLNEISNFAIHYDWKIVNC